MKPTEFDEQNTNFVGPSGSGIAPLPAHVSREQGMIVTRWEPTPEERAMIAEGHPVWLIMLTAGPPVPVSLVAKPSPFEESEP